MGTLIRNRLLVSIGATVLFTVTAAHAHHSRAGFDLEGEIELTGTISRIRWGNPHIFLTVEDAEGVTWTIEGHSIPGVTQLGWRRDTFQVGDTIIAGGSPNLDPEKKFILLNWAIARDGKAYQGFPRSSIPERYADIDAGGRQQMMAHRMAVFTGNVEPSSDYSGNWMRDQRGRNLLTGASFDKPTGLPLTDAGEAVLAEYDATENPAYSCVPSGVPRGLTGPYGYRIDRFDNRLEVHKEHDKGVWTIWLDEASVPDEEPSRFGTSVGRFDSENLLLVEVTNFSAEKWELARGLDSSDQKSVSMRFAMQPNQRTIEVSYVISDPVFLTEPIERSFTWLKEPDRAFNDLPCDPENSSFHLQFE